SPSGVTPSTATTSAVADRMMGSRSRMEPPVRMRVADLIYDEVDELARHDDRLPDPLAVHVRLHPRRRQSPLDELLLGRARGNLDAVAHLAVHLDHELERLALQQPLVGDRPGRLPQARVAQDAPQ